MTKKIKISSDEFNVLVSNLNVSDQTKDITRGVLVEGIPQSFYVKKYGISKGAVSQAVNRIHRIYSSKGGKDVLYSKPLQVSLDKISEDPNQPRKDNNPGFSIECLSDLAKTISSRGVKSPISIRDNPNKPGCFIINHGARRFRASKIAGKTTVPAFIDNDYLEVDQIIENLQRNELTSLEIAEFVNQEIKRGKKKREIASAIGKSPAFVSQHAVLLDLPPVIDCAFKSGRVKDVTIVSEILKAYRKDQKEVLRFLDEEQEINRGSVSLLRNFINEKENKREIIKKKHINESADEAEKEPTPNPKKKEIIIRAVYNDRLGRLLYKRHPSRVGNAWFVFDNEFNAFEIDLTQIRIVAITCG